MATKSMNEDDAVDLVSQLFKAAYVVILAPLLLFAPCWAQRESSIHDNE